MKIYNRCTSKEILDTGDADLRVSDLSYANLRDADLRYANLSGAIGDISVFSGGKDQGIATCTHIFIGCQARTHTEWRKHYARIGENNQYTAEEIERYRAWIFSLDWLIKE